MRVTFAAEGSGPFASATIPFWDMGRALREGVLAEGAHAWLRRLASEAIVRRACVRSAAMGGATGLFTTLTSIAAAESDGLAGLVTIPAAAVAVCAELLARGGVHLTMVCAIADLFELTFDAEDPADLWALLALSFGPESTPANPPRAGEQIIHLASVKAEEVAHQIGKWIVGESVVRNAVPFLSVLSSSAMSWMVTRRLGDNARRYARYRRAFDDVFRKDPALAAYLDLVIEGVWFIFTADGRLEPEESALLASLVRRCDPTLHARMAAELADDIGWVARLPRIPEALRDPFLHVLEVAAAVDKRATLRERSLLEHAARALGRREDFGGLERMLRDFRETGVLSEVG